MKMKGFIFLVVNLAVSSNGIEVKDIGKDEDIEEANKGLISYMIDDILMSPQRSAINNEDILWTSPVPYVLEKDLEMNAKGVTLRAFDQFRLKSCIDFKPRESETYYISVQKLGGCFSYIGRVIANGQVLSIGTYCDGISIVEHEFLHALGFYHEQSRYDRDNYVTINFGNITAGFEGNFVKASSEVTTTNGVAYDYWSVMHYGKNAFSNGNGSTIITKDPKFQDVIGQRLEVSASDVKELNLLYKCNSSIAFQKFCDFSGQSMCQMNHCSQSDNDWKVVTTAQEGPTSDHTSLPSGNGERVQDTGYFMHASTASGKEGDTATLETQRMSPKRDCHVQCLQFYYYHSGNGSDELNIWLREFQDEQDSTGTRRHVGQITGHLTSQWRLHHVSLNATKHFQVEFEVRKGAGSSRGGFSIDDINLSETECPHVTLQIDDFEKLLNTSNFGTPIYSPRHYSAGGYAYRVALVLYSSYFGLFVQLLSGDNDDKLEWPCPQRQVTFQMLDQNANIQLQMSKQTSITTDPTLMSSEGTFYWDNPREIGTQYVDENNEAIYAGPLLGRSYFSTLGEMRYREFLKGGSAIFVFGFQDLTPLINGSVLPCPQVGPGRMTHTHRDEGRGPCSSRVGTTAVPTPTPPQTTDDESTSPTTHPTTTPPQTTDDERTSSTTYPTPTPPETTDDESTSPTTYPTATPPPTTDDESTSPTTYPTPTPPQTTDDEWTSPTTYPMPTPPHTTDDERSSSTTYPTPTPPQTTDDEWSSSTTYPTPTPPETTDDERSSSTTYPTPTPPETTDDERTSPTTYPTPTPPETTDDERSSSTTYPTPTPTPPETTDDEWSSSTTYPTPTPPETTDDESTSPTTYPTPTPPQTTDDDRILTTLLPPPQTTDDDSIFGFSPGMVASPLLTFLLALILLMP